MRRTRHPVHEGVKTVERVADAISAATGKETRVVVLGHLQRGGLPATFDHVLGTRFGAAAARLIREGQFGRMVALLPPNVESIPINEAIFAMKKVPLSNDILESAREPRIIGRRRG